MLVAEYRHDTASDVESRYRSADQFLQWLVGSSGRHDLRQRLQDPMRRVHAACRARHAIPMDLARRRKGSAACGTRTPELGAAQMAAGSGPRLISRPIPLDENADFET